MFRYRTHDRRALCFSASGEQGAELHQDQHQGQHSDPPVQITGQSADSSWDRRQDTPAPWLLNGRYGSGISVTCVSRDCEDRRSDSGTPGVTDGAGMTTVASQYILSLLVCNIDFCEGGGSPLLSFCDECIYAIFKHAAHSIFMLKR